jgi:hypothetical protein
VSFFLGLPCVFNVYLLVATGDAISNSDNVTSNDWKIMANDLELRKEAVVE